MLASDDKEGRKGPGAITFIEDEGLQVYTIKSFCSHYGFTTVHLWMLRKEGRGPRVMKLGRRVVITKQAALEWEAAMEEKPEDLGKPPTPKLPPAGFKFPDIEQPAVKKATATKATSKAQKPPAKKAAAKKTSPKKKPAKAGKAALTIAPDDKP
jgi:hypothetical protein